MGQPRKRERSRQALRTVMLSKACSAITHRDTWSGQPTVTTRDKGSGSPSATHNSLCRAHSNAEHPCCRRSCQEERRLRALLCPSCPGFSKSATVVISHRVIPRRSSRRKKCRSFTYICSDCCQMAGVCSAVEQFLFSLSRIPVSICSFYVASTENQ